MEKVLFTEKQLSRMERNKEIIASFKSLRKRNPDISPQRLFATIAEDYDISAAAIRQICQRSGVHVNRESASREG